MALATAPRRPRNVSSGGENTSGSTVNFLNPWGSSWLVLFLAALASVGALRIGEYSIRVLRKTWGAPFLRVFSRLGETFLPSTGCFHRSLSQTSAFPKGQGRGHLSSCPT
ncbi:hypothetical protein KM043_007918 [Ampulex compressa]|nr:hypothetical protein KM043_007918 [Ampulex compressa]